MHPLAKEFHDGCQGATPEEIEEARQWYLFHRLLQLIDDAPAEQWVSIDPVYQQMVDEGFPIRREELNRMLEFLHRKGIIGGLQGPGNQGLQDGQDRTRKLSCCP
jgi:hypothetical protein